tara:strand:- start:11746 stop:12132 length:387 start_codon:yes stop_codon:yes gene_type:complete
MAIFTTTTGSPSVLKIYRDLECNAAAELLNDGAVNIQQIFIDNTLNTTSFYLTMWNRDGSGGEPTTPGSTAPDMVIFCPAGKSKNYIFPRKLIWSAALSHFGATNFAATSFTPTAPSSAVKVTYYTTA